MRLDSIMTQVLHEVIRCSGKYKYDLFSLNPQRPLGALSDVFYVKKKNSLRF